MSTSVFIAILSVGTITAILAFALISKKKTQERSEKDAPSSCPAKDGPGPSPVTDQ